MLTRDKIKQQNRNIGVKEWQITGGKIKIDLEVIYTYLIVNKSE